jgi:DnaJ homolog subfamily C member 3
MRAESRMILGDTRGAIADIRSVTRMSNDNTDGYLKLSKMYYEIGETEESLRFVLSNCHYLRNSNFNFFCLNREIRECLRLDSDHKQCFAHYKLVKKVAKAMTDMNSALGAEDFETCVSEGKKVVFI